MIVDTSALVAVVTNEPEAETFNNAMAEASSVKVAAGTLLEACIVLDRRGPRHSRNLDRLLMLVDAEIVPTDAEHVRVARLAHRDFGRGSGHPASLNLGDCFAYALASVTGEPLLFKGDDFTHTDIRSAV